MKVLVFQAIGTLLFAAILANLANAISDFRLCADESCDKVISKGTTLQKHFATESTELSFDAGEKVEIYSKSAGVQLDYWGGKINGERGYFPYQVIQEDEVFVQIPEHVRPTEENTDEFDTELDDEEEVDEEEDDQEDDDYGDDDVGDATEDQASNDDSLDEDAPDSHQAASESDNTEADSEPSGETDDSAANIHTSDNPEDDSTDNQSARDDKDASIKSQSESDEVDASPDLSRTASDLEEFDSHSSDDAENTETVSETHLSPENDASDEASDVPSEDSTTVDSEEINQHVAEDREVQDSTVSSSEESLSSTPSGDDTEVKERDIEADVRDTYISATETEHTDDHQTVLSSEHKLPAEQSVEPDVSDTPLDEIQKREPEEFEVTMEASSELEASKTGDSIEPSMISVDEIKVSVTEDLTVIPGKGVPDDSSTQIVKDIDIAPLTDTASGHSDESDNIINVEATEPLDENEGDDDVRTTIVDGTVIDLDEYEYSAVITPSQTFSDLDLPDLPTPAISDTKPSPSPATIEDKVDTVQPTSVLDGIDVLSITDISGHAGDAYSPSPGDFMSRKTLEVTEPGIDGSQPEEPHTDYETVTDSPIEHEASPLIEEDVTVTPKPVTHASVIEPPTIPQLGTEEEVDAFCADKLTATNGMLLTYVQAVNNVDRVMDKILFVLPGTVRSFLEIEFLGMPQCRKLEMLLLMIYWFLVYLFYKWINYGLTVRRHRKHVTIAEMEHERFCFEIERNTAQRELKEALEKMKEFENCTAITNEEVQHQKLQQEKTEREAQKLNKLLKNKTDELELMRQELSQQTASLQEACQQNNDYQTRIAEMNDHTKLIEKQLAEAKNELMNASSQVTSSTFQADNMAEQISLLQQSKDQLLLESEGWNEKVTELNSVVEQLSEEKKFIQEQNDYKDSEIEVLRDCYKKLKVVGSSENDEEDSENTDYILQEKFQDMTNVARVNTILNAVEEEKASMKQKLKIEIESREELEGQVRLLQSQMEMMKEGNRKAQEQSEDATTRLAVLSNYFKEKELQMQKALGEQEANRKEKDNILETKEEQKKRVEAELHLNREQIEDLKGEIENAESNYRKQISVHEKKAHENWLAARQAERDLKEAKSEAVTLRQKLTASEEERQHLNHVGLIRPLATRPMPPPGMMNGPPPRPSPPPMPPLRDGSPLDRGRPPPFMPLDRPLPPHMRGDGRHQMGPPPMDPRSPPSDMRSPPPPPHMGRHSPPHRSPPPHMRRSPPPPGHMDRRSPPPLYHGPPPPHRMGPMPPRGPPPPHGYSRHPPSMDRPYRDHSPPPPPPPHIRPGMQEPHDPRTSSPRDGRPNF